MQSIIVGATKNGGKRGGKEKLGKRDKSSKSERSGGGEIKWLTHMLMHAE